MFKPKSVRIKNIYIYIYIYIQKQLNGNIVYKRVVSVSAFNTQKQQK